MRGQRDALAGVPGVQSADVSLADHRAVVVTSNGLATRKSAWPLRWPLPDIVCRMRPLGLSLPAQEVAALPSPLQAPRLASRRSAGAPRPDSGPAADRPTSAELLLDIQGMHCASCVGNIERAVTKLPGVRSAHANLATEQAAVEYDPQQTAPEAVLAAIDQAGYQAAVHTGAEAVDRSEQELAAWRRRLWIGGALVGALAALHLAPTAWHWSHTLQLALATALQFYIGWPFLLGAWRRLRNLSANMDTLVALGTLAAYGSGAVDWLHGMHGMQFMDAGMILVFITLGKYLETRSKRNASRRDPQTRRAGPAAGHRRSRPRAAQSRHRTSGRGRNHRGAARRPRAARRRNPLRQLQPG